MNENLFEAQYDITKKSKFKRFYESNKVLIFSSIFILVIIFGVLGYYFENKERKKILLSDNYVQAKIYLADGNTNKATQILKEVIFSNDATYSTLSFFLILNQNLIKDYKEQTVLFNHLLNNNEFENEVKNLLIYKKALFHSNSIEEKEFLEDINILLNSKTLWKPHALLLAGDFFTSKKEYIKAKEFYNQIFLLKNLEKDFYDQAKSRLVLISND